MHEPRRILIIRPSALGDVCRSVPVLVSLKRRFPHAAIDWLVQDSFVPAITAHPDLGRAIPFRRGAMRGTRLFSGSGRAALGELWRALRSPGDGGKDRRMRSDGRDAHPTSDGSDRYDIVFDCQGLLRSGLFALATGAPARVGYANAGEFGWIGCNRRHLVPRDRHAVERMLALVEAQGVPAVRDLRLYAPERDRAAIDARLKSSRFVLLAPSSRWEGKRWPAERFVEVARTVLAARSAEFVVVVASESERGQCGALLEFASHESRMIDLIGRTSIGKLMAVVERAALVIANDSAALHMAVGFDRPLVGLFGPTRVDLVGPYGRERDVIQPVTPPPPGVTHKDAAAGRGLMKQITVEQVLSAAMERLGAGTAGASR